MFDCKGNLEIHNLKPNQKIEKETGDEVFAKSKLKRYERDVVKQEWDYDIQIIYDKSETAVNCFEPSINLTF